MGALPNAIVVRPHLSLENRANRDRMVRAATDHPLVTAHAARRPNGDLPVPLLDKDPDAAHDVAIGYPGYTPSSAACAAG